MESYAYLNGLLTGASLLIAIGAQNAFVIKQGLMKNHVFVTALYCAIADALLITLGVIGLGPFLTSNWVLMYIAGYGGAAFLFWYGYRAFKAAFQNEKLKIDLSSEAPSFKKTLILVSVFTLLNPNVYLDTVILIGSISTQFCSTERFYYAFGAITSSFLWFFTIGYGARLLTPLFENPKAWKVLDFLIGCIMWTIGISLIWNLDKLCTI